MDDMFRVYPVGDSTGRTLTSGSLLIYGSVLANGRLLCSSTRSSVSSLRVVAGLTPGAH